jgi:hypothetical protein
MTHSLVGMMMELTVHEITTCGPLNTLTETLKHFPTPVTNESVMLSDGDPLF